MNARESDSYGSYIDWRPLRRPPSRDIHLMGSTSKPQIRGHTCVRAHYEFQLRVRQQAFTINHLKRYMWNQCKALQSIKCPEHENWRTFWYMGDPQRARASCFSFCLRFGFCFWVFGLETILIDVELRGNVEHGLTSQRKDSDLSSGGALLSPCFTFIVKLSKVHSAFLKSARWDKWQPRHDKWQTTHLPLSTKHRYTDTELQIQIPSRV